MTGPGQGWSGQGWQPPGGGHADPFSSPPGHGQGDSPFSAQGGTPGWQASVGQDNVAGYEWVAPPQHPRRARIGAWLIAGVAVLGVLTAVTVVLLRSGESSSSLAESKKGAASSAVRPPPTHPVPTSPQTTAQMTDTPVSFEAARQTLLSPAEVASLVGLGDLQSTWDYPALSTNSVRPRMCGGIITPALGETYDGSGYTQTRTQILENDNAHVWQQVSTFQSDAGAKDFVETLEPKWRSCANTELTLTGAAGWETWRSDVPTLAAGVLTISLKVDTLDGTKVQDNYFRCQRALSARRNVVVDVYVCELQGSSSLKAVPLLQKIADRVPHG